MGGLRRFDSVRCGSPSRKGRNVNTRDPQTLIEKLKNLPPERVAEVEDFVDFLHTRDEAARDGAAQRLGEAMAKLAPHSTCRP